LTKDSDWHLQANQSAEARIKAPEVDVGFTRQQRAKRNRDYVLGTGEPAMDYDPNDPRFSRSDRFFMTIGRFVRKRYETLKTWLTPAFLRKSKEASGKPHFRNLEDRDP
jgi:hypothetical protein